MPSIRFRLDPASLDAVEQKARERFGELARVLSTEEVRVGGIGGFFARRAIDVVVELPDVAAPQHWTAHRRAPLNDLLDYADSNDVALAPSAVPPLSTESDAFTHVLADLKRYAQTTGPVLSGTSRTKRPVVLLRAPGDLVVIAGIAGDPLSVATSLALAGAMPGEPSPFEVASAGTIAAPGVTRVADRRSAFSARARGLEGGRATIVAWGISPGEDALASEAAALATLRPDQVWVAVDASRKHADTERWVTALCTVLPVQAMAVLRTAWTSTPESVFSLGLPEGWSDALG